MNWKAEILARFSGEPRERPLYLPDLTLWYDWRRTRGTLPPGWGDGPLPDVARAMGVPIWWAVRPWRVETPGVATSTLEREDERVIHHETVAGRLTSRWVRGPDGDWWQSEYPVKSAGELPAALKLVEARSYILDPAAWTQAEALVGDDGIVALEIPRRPYSDVLHELLGWGEGVMLLEDHRPAVEEIIAILEDKLQRIVREVAPLPGAVVFSPDNLDGQYISPPAFQSYLEASYRLTVGTLHRHGKLLLVHVGGPIKRLLRYLAAAGVDGIEGLAGPPQSDLTLAAAREIAGPAMTLWGGIPQDFLLSTHTVDELEAAVRQTAQEVQGDHRMLLGVADRVPAGADLDRLQALGATIARALA